ncbi:hypothetical protein [Nocardioides sp. B-3]|uniref:hypothetical protein n=1 Tax=Nocardioides sp. B-3 TaxID=2895565 RepID=UPI0021539E23|nr:hypothetical protein [Nocardioides sp. B-3]UUZ57683.1 hypothetical protein LP418_14655 [Nocardioides sp. B-3]
MRSFFNRQPTQILIGVAVFSVYGGALLGVLPGQPGISGRATSSAPWVASWWRG